MIFNWKYCDDTIIGYYDDETNKICIAPWLSKYNRIRKIVIFHEFGHMDYELFVKKNNNIVTKHIMHELFAWYFVLRSLWISYKYRDV